MPNNFVIAVAAGLAILAVNRASRPVPASSAAADQSGLARLFSGLGVPVNAPGTPAQFLFDINIPAAVTSDEEIGVFPAPGVASPTLTSQVIEVANPTIPVAQSTPRVTSGIFDGPVAGPVANPGIDATGDAPLIVALLGGREEGFGLVAPRQFSLTEPIFVASAPKNVSQVPFHTTAGVLQRYLEQFKS